MWRWTSKSRELDAARSFLRAAIGTMLFIVGIALLMRLWAQWGLVPHRYCLINNPMLVWSTAATNLVIAFVYFATPTAMLALVRAVPGIFFSPRLVYLYACFIALCGLTHVMIVVTLFYPAYYLQLGVDLACAIGSAATFRELLRSRQAIERFVAHLRETAHDSAILGRLLRRHPELFAEADELRRRAWAGAFPFTGDAVG